MPDDDGGPPENGPDGPGVAVGSAGADAPPVEAAEPAAEPATDPDGVVAAQPAPDEEAGPAELVATRLADIEAALTALVRFRDAEAERAAARERVIERQHADIERMRTDERFGAMRPVLVELCRLRNDLLRQAGTLPADLTVEKMARLLESFASSVEDTLLGCGVEVLPREVGDRFVPRRQQVARVVETDDATQDGTVAEIVQDGYGEVDGGRVVVPARVAVHRAAAPAVKDTDDTDATKEHVDA